MGSNGCDEVMISGSNECSEATVEIKIKTLDSQTYTLRVDKCVRTDVIPLFTQLKILLLHIFLLGLGN